jgi:hypothetical protein
VENDARLDRFMSKVTVQISLRAVEKVLMSGGVVSFGVTVFKEIIQWERHSIRFAGNAITPE